MARGTWQGSGTWQTSGGPDIGDVALIFAVCAIAGVVVEVVLSIIVWIAVALGIVTALAVSLLIWRLRGVSVRKARYDAAYTAAFDRYRESRTVTATVTPPQVSQGTRAPAIENHYHIHFDPADREAARIIRTVLPGMTGEIITEE